MAKTNLQWAAVKMCVWSSIAPPQKCEPPERLLFYSDERVASSASSYLPLVRSATKLRDQKVSKNENQLQTT